MKRKLILGLTLITASMITLSSCSIIKKTDTDDSKNKKITFGMYPQTKITNDSVIEELNSLAGNLPSSTDTYNWTAYNYYMDGAITNYMYYQDIDYDNDGDYDYRGVYFEKYRPSQFDLDYYIFYEYSSMYTNNSCQYMNGYSKETIYWFSFDPIEWDVLKEENGKSLILANLIVDSQEYYPSNSEVEFIHNGGTGYANNYELSAIRKFINNDFYNNAFNNLEKEKIETTLVDNSLSSSEAGLNKYACDDTQDKVFLLSYKEFNDYNKFEFEGILLKNGTDYAKCQGLWVGNWGGSYWWLRSPYHYSDEDTSCYAYHVDIIQVDGRHIDNSFGYRSGVGVCPACWVKL